MSEYLVNDTDLTSVANAIRTKGGTSSPLAFPSGFVSAVNAIPSGGGGDVSYDNYKIYFHCEVGYDGLGSGSTGIKIEVSYASGVWTTIYDKTWTDEGDAIETTFNLDSTKSRCFIKCTLTQTGDGDGYAELVCLPSNLNYPSASNSLYSQVSQNSFGTIGGTPYNVDFKSATIYANLNIQE